MMSSGTDAFLSFTMSWCSVLVVLVVVSASILLPKMRENNIIISETILPSYEWDQSSGRLVPHFIGIATLYGGLFVGISWGVAATLFLNQLYIGMSASSFCVVVCCIVTAALSNHGKAQFSRAISSLQASESLVLDPPTDAESGLKRKSLVETTIREALLKSNKLFAETGDVDLVRRW